MIPSYLPQDTQDLKDYEGEKNPILVERRIQNELDEEDDEESSTEKDHGKTRRENWKFWLMKDTIKAIRLLKGSKEYDATFEPEYRIYPNLKEACLLLLNTKNETLYIDIETDSNRSISCVGFNFSGSNVVYVVPFRRYDYVRAYDNLHWFLYALAVSFRQNIVVAHNGAGFDFLVFALKYSIGIGRNVHDTMLIQARCFPGVEKSLGHSISMWTNEPYHKDDGVFMPNNSSQDMALWTYNGRDVYTMRLVHERQIRYAKTQPGLEDSVAQVNRSIRPYIINTMMGIRYNEEKRQSIVHYNDRCMNQYLRCIRVLAGRDVLPSSNKQCVQYFHEELGLPVAGFTGTGSPSLDEKNMLKLKLKVPDNVAIDVFLAYRRCGKQSGSLKFNPWKPIQT